MTHSFQFQSFSYAQTIFPRAFPIIEASNEALRKIFNVFNFFTHSPSSGVEEGGSKSYKRLPRRRNKL